MYYSRVVIVVILNLLSKITKSENPGLCQHPPGTIVASSEIYGKFETIVKKVITSPLGINDTLCIKLNQNPKSKSLKIVLKNIEFRHVISSTYQFVPPDFKIFCKQQCSDECNCQNLDISDSNYKFGDSQCISKQMICRSNRVCKTSATWLSTTQPNKCCKLIVGTKNLEDEKYPIFRVFEVRQPAAAVIAHFRIGRNSYKLDLSSRSMIQHKFKNKKNSKIPIVVTVTGPPPYSDYNIQERLLVQGRSYMPFVPFVPFMQNEFLPKIQEKSDLFWGFLEFNTNQS